MVSILLSLVCRSVNFGVAIRLFFSSLRVSFEKPVKYGGPELAIHIVYSRVDFGGLPRLESRSHRLAAIILLL